MAQTLLICSDLHINSSVALCPPSVQLDDGGSYHPSRGQHWLWENWLKLAALMEKYPGFTLIANGDLLEGDTKNRSYQVISRNKATILSMTAKVLDPLIKEARAVYVVRGTEAHVGKSGNLEEILADDIEATACPETKARSWWELPLSVEGVRLDIAHHTNMPGLPWTQPSAAQKLAAQVMFYAADRGQVIPDLVIRSHMHRWGDSYDAHRTRAIVTPAWTLASSYTHRIAPGKLAEVGALIIHIDAGYYEIEKYKVEPQKRIWTSLPKPIS